MNVERLIQIAEHLEKGQLGHVVFHYSSFNAKEKTRDGTTVLVNHGHTCGTHGCAMGEFPIIWPDFWYFDNSGRPELHGGVTNSFADAAFWLDLNLDEIHYLFNPFAHNNRLPKDASKEMVAAHIRAFVIAKQNSEHE